MASVVMPHSSSQSAMACTALALAQGVGYLGCKGENIRREPRGEREGCSFPNGINAGTAAKARHQGQGRRLWGQVAGRARSARVVSATDTPRWLQDKPQPRCVEAPPRLQFTGRRGPRAAQGLQGFFRVGYLARSTANRMLL